MSSEKSIRSYQQQCHKNYISAIGLSDNYTYLDGNPIRPVPPVQTAPNGLMIIGAYPSARFERRRSLTHPKRFRTIPIADNLQPFGYEQYFDGLAVRTLTSADGLYKYLFSNLRNATFTTSWITDLVKVFLFKEEHIEACRDVNPNFKGVKTRNRFEEFASKSVSWVRNECQFCSPKLIIALGEEVARVLFHDNAASADLLLSQNIRHPESLDGYATIFLPHPDACRRSEKWRRLLKSAIPIINGQLNSKR
jgi:hypothetical protein